MGVFYELFYGHTLSFDVTEGDYHLDDSIIRSFQIVAISFRLKYDPATVEGVSDQKGVLCHIC